MEKKEYYLGKRLQFVLYAMAVEEHFKLGEVSSSIYWSIPTALSIGPAIENPQDGLQKKEFVRMLVDEYVEGIRAGHFEPHAPDDGCPSYCTAAKWCWHYQPKE